MICIESYYCWLVTKFVWEIRSRVLDGCYVKLLHEYFEGCWWVNAAEKMLSIQMETIKSLFCTERCFRLIEQE